MYVFKKLLHAFRAHIKRVFFFRRDIDSFDLEGIMKKKKDSDMQNAI